MPRYHTKERMLCVVEDRKEDRREDKDLNTGLTQDKYADIDANADYMNLAEFAAFVGISPNTLLNYDRKGIFKPAKRGDARNNKYRYYSPMQITTVKVLRVLNDLGIPLGAMKELMEDRNLEGMAKLMNKHDGEVEAKIRYYQEMHNIIRTTANSLNEALAANEKEITISEMPKKQITLGEPTDFRGITGFTKEFLRFCGERHEPMLNLSLPIGGYFDDMDAFLNEPSLPMRFFSIDPKGNDVKPEGLYLIGYNRGYYGETGDLPQRMVKYAKKHGLIFSGPVYNIYVIDEISETDPNRYLLQASVLVTETRNLANRRAHR